MGPWWGWQGGWAITMTGVLVIGALADVGVRFGLLTLGLDELADNKAVIMIGAVALILLMTAICVLGTELSARLQNVLIVFQVALAAHLRGGGASARVFAGDATAESITPSLSWLNPFAAGGGALSAGLLLGVFAYWGWESAVNLCEETTDSTTTPGRAAILSTVLLLTTYLSVAIAIVAFMGPDFLTANAEEEEFIFGLVATEVLGDWAWILLFSVTTSAIASTQTTIIPASRTALSMARRRAFPPTFGHIHHRFKTPDVSTWWVAAIAIVWYVVINLISENALFDSLTALSLLIAFYYALTGVACAIYYRRQLTSSLRNSAVHRRRAGRRGDHARLAAGRFRSSTCRTRRTRTAGRRGSGSGPRSSSASRSSSPASSSCSLGARSTTATGRSKPRSSIRRSCRRQRTAPRDRGLGRLADLVVPGAPPARQAGWSLPPSRAVTRMSLCVGCPSRSCVHTITASLPSK